MTHSNTAKRHLTAVQAPADSTPRVDDGGAVIDIRAAASPFAPTVIAVTSGKGGVGKTNLSVNLAIALGRRGARTLAIDADLGLANMDIVMGVAPTYTTAELVRGEVEIEDVLVEGPENVWLLPGASGRYDLANLDDRGRQALFNAVDGLDDRFDCVVVDTGAGVGSNAVGFASAAKDIVVVVTPEPTSIADAYGIVKVLSTRCGVRRLRVVANMVSSAAEGERVFRRINSLAERFLDVVLDYIGHIPRDPVIQRSVVRGQPFTTLYPEAPASRAVDGLAGKLLAADDPDDRQGAIRLFWRKLLRQGGSK